MQEKAMIYAERSDVLQGVNYIAGKRQNYGKKPRGTQMSAEPWWPVPTHLQDFRCILAPKHHTCLKPHSRACTHAHAHKKRNRNHFVVSRTVSLIKESVLSRFCYTKSVMFLSLSSLASQC